MKHDAARASLQRPLEDQIETPMQLYDWAKVAIYHQHRFHYVDIAEVDAE